MHIAIVHRDLYAVTRGGIGTIYRALAPRLFHAGHSVTLVTQDSPAPLVLPGVTTTTLPRTDDLLIHRARVADALVELRPDMVESSSWEAETLDYLHRPPRYRAPVLVRGDVSALTMTHTLSLAAAEHELVHRAERVVAVSGFAATDLSAAYRIPDPPVVLNGVDRSRFHPAAMVDRVPRSGQRITLATDATPATRTPLAGISAVLTTPWSRTDDRIQLIWVGKTTPMKGWDRLERLATEIADLAHITVLLGHAPALCPVRLSGDPDDPITVLRDLSEADLPGFYRSADYLLSTSRWEGTGLAIAEALASGTPVLLPERLDVARDLLAAGGGRTYRDAAQLRALLTAPRPVGALPSRFDWEANVGHTLAHYRDLLDHRGPSAA